MISSWVLNAEESLCARSLWQFCFPGRSLFATGRRLLAMEFCHEIGEFGAAWRQEQIVYAFCLPILWILFDKAMSGAAGEMCQTAAVRRSFDSETFDVQCSQSRAIKSPLFIFLLSETVMKVAARLRFCFVILECIRSVACTGEMGMRTCDVLEKAVPPVHRGCMQAIPNLKFEYMTVIWTSSLHFFIAFTRRLLVVRRDGRQGHTSRIQGNVVLCVAKCFFDNEHPA